jgi:ABC-type polysaccharide/polyol phosphate transport system ATPase subunit
VLNNQGLGRVSSLRAGEMKLHRIGKLYSYRSNAPGSDGDPDAVDLEPDADDDDGLTAWPKRKVEVWALREVTCHIRRGERVAVIGANGAGKSTLVRILSRTLPPSEGTVDGAGIVVPFGALRSPISPHMSGCDNLRMIARLLGIPSAHLEERLPKIIEFSEIGHLAHEKVHRYSDRSFARLSMAMGLFIDADIYLVEDAIKIGDENYRVKFMDKLAEVLQREVTLVHASNSLELLRNYCQSAIWLEAGRLRAVGEINTLIRRFLSATENVEELTDIVAAERQAPAPASRSIPAPTTPGLGTLAERLEPVTEWVEATVRAEESWEKVLQRWREKLTVHDLANSGSLEMVDKCRLGTIHGSWCLNSDGKPVRRALPGEPITLDLLVETFSANVTVAVRLELDAVQSMLIFIAEPLVPLRAQDPGLYLFRAKIDGNLLAHSFESLLYKLRTRVVMRTDTGPPQMVAATVRFDLRGDIRADFDDQRAAQGERPTSVLQPTPAFVEPASEIEGSDRVVLSGNMGTQWDKLNRKPALRPRLEWMVYRVQESAADVQQRLGSERQVEVAK